MLGGSLCLARDGGFPTALHVLTASGQTSQPSKCCIQSGAVNGLWRAQPTNTAEESARSESVSLVISKSTVAEESLVQWLTALLFRAVKSMRYCFYSQDAFHPSLHLWRNIPVPNCWAISAGNFNKNKHFWQTLKKKNTARKEKNCGPLKIVGNSCIIWSKATAVTPVPITVPFWQIKDNWCRIKPFGKQKKSRSSGCRALH